MTKADFVQACRTRRHPIANYSVGGHASILCQLSNMSLLNDAGFDWDPVRNAFANGTGDRRWLVRRDEYRGGFQARA